MPARRIDPARLTSLADGERTIREIARLAGLSEPTVSRWLRRLNLPRRPVGNRSQRGGHSCFRCGTRTAAIVDALGRVRMECAGCQRHAAGWCLDCPRRLDKPKALRCPECRARRRRAYSRSHYRRHRDTLLAREKQLRDARDARSPEQRAHRLAVKKAWRERNKLRITLSYRRKQRLSGRGGFATRERYLAYHRDYNAARKLEKRAYMRQRAKFAREAPRCRVCGEVVAWGGKGRPPLDCVAHTRNPRIRARQSAA